MNTRPVIEGVAVDLNSVAGIAHDCDPALCRGARCCCSCYEITLTEEELSPVVGMLPAAARFSRRLKRGDGYDNVFDEEDDGLYTIDSARDGSCVFLYRDHLKTPLCSLHTAALESGADPYRAKPGSCTLWPLALSEDSPPVLTVQDDAFDFPCNRRRRGGRKGLDRGVSIIIVSVFGESFLDTVRLHLSKPGG